MMDLQTMREREDEAAAGAKDQELEPAEAEEGILNLWKEGKVPTPIEGIPFLGDYVPPGWEEVPFDDPAQPRLFVDTSGFGGDGEPALTQDQFFKRLEAGYGYAIVEAGQFQAYVARFKRV